MKQNKTGIVLLECHPSRGSEAEIGYKILCHFQGSREYKIYIAQDNWFESNHQKEGLQNMGLNLDNVFFVKSNSLVRLVNRVNRLLSKSNHRGLGKPLLWWISRELLLRDAIQHYRSNYSGIIHVVTPIHYLLLIPSIGLNIVRGPVSVPDKLGKFWIKLIGKKRYIKENFRYNLAIVINRINRKLNNIRFIALNDSLKNNVIDTLSDANGVEELYDRENTAVNERLNVVWVGRIETRKGIDLLYKFCESGCFSNCCLHVIGSGSRLEELEHRLSEFSFIQVHGQLSRENLFKILNNSDAYISTSFREGTPHAMMEALSAGLTPIYIPVGGLRNLDSEEFSCPLQADNLDDLVRELKDYLCRREEYFTRSRKTEIKKWSRKRDWSFFNEELERIYGRINSSQ